MVKLVECVVLLCVGAGAGSWARVVREAETFEIDPVHSSIVFRIRHFDMANFYGMITGPTGSFSICEGGSLDVTIEIKNVDGGNESRNRFLAGPDLFNARDYPTARFTAKRIRDLGDGRFEATGDFTLKGITRELTVELQGYNEREVPRFGHRAAFETTFTIKRTEFGMPTHVEERVLGDEVTLTVSLEGVRQP